MLWAPLYQEEARGDAPRGCLWRKQIDIPLRWIKAFLNRSSMMVREFSLAEHFNEGVHVRITTDASPFGLGGFITINNIIREYFHDPLTEADAKRFGHPLGCSTGQQTWEALALLMALRVWSPLWSGRRVVLSVRSDSVSALMAVLTLSSQGTNTNLIAREMALDIADSIYRPSVIAHIPGICNVIADVLSRWYDPSKKAELPAPLVGATLRLLPRRDDAFFRAAVPP